MIKLPEPDTHCEDLDTGQEVWSYSKELLQQAIRDALEEAAMVCEARQTPGTGSVAILNGAADAIRALKETIQ